MQANKRSTSKTSEEQGQTEGSRSKLAPENQPEVIEKKSTSIQFQENEPEVHKKTSSQTTDPEADVTEDQEKEPSQTPIDDDNKPEVQKQTSLRNEDDASEDQNTGIQIQFQENEPEVKTSSQTTDDESGATESQENEPSQTDIDENEDNSVDQDDDEPESDKTPSQTATDEGYDNSEVEEDDESEGQEMESSQTDLNEDDGKPDAQEDEESEDQETEPSQQNRTFSGETEGEDLEGQEEQAAQDTAGSSTTTKPDSKGSQAIENASTQSSIITSGSSEKLLPHLSSSGVVIDKATLSDNTESTEKVPEQLDDEDEDESQNGARHRDALLPSISSEDVVEEEPAMDESKADYAFSMFTNVLQEAEQRRSTEENLEPVVHQNLQFTIEATEEDIKEHFAKKPVRKPSTQLQRKSSLKLGPKPSTRLSRLRPPELKIEVSDKVSPSKLAATGQAPTPSELCSEWEPGKDEPKVGYHYRLKSWVGDYILGYDYWSTKEDNPEQEVKEVRFNIDDGNRWYDMSMSDAKISKSAIDEKRDVSMKKIEALKVKAPTDIKRGEKKLPIAYNPKEPVDEHLKGDLKDMFMEFAKNDTSTAKNRMSLKNADKWLEKVDLLDHKNLTLVHTGLCFRAAGGSRYRGLTFQEFFTFVEMIADTRSMPLQHAINRLKYAVLDITIGDRMK